MSPLPAQLEKLAKSLSAQIAGDAYFDPYRRALYGTDASLYQVRPAGVVLPKNRDDVAYTVRAAARCGLPIVSRGGGTSLSGQSIGAGIVIDFSKYMNRILDLDPESCTARVEPGVVLDQLNAAALPHGLQFGPDVATSNRANLGGMIGNNSAGARSIVHGKTVDHVIALDVVLADGSAARFEPIDPDELEKRKKHQNLEGQIHRQVPRIIQPNRNEILARFPNILRRVSGYNLDEFVPECKARTPLPPSVERIRQIEACRYPGADFNLSKLVVGGEGSLGCVVEALVHLVPLPRERGILVLEFDSLAAAIDAVATVLSRRPSAVELLDKMILELASESLEYRNYLDFVKGKPESLVLAELSGDSADEVRSQIESLAAELRGHPGLMHVTPVLEPRQREKIWECRKAALPLLMGIPGVRKPIAFVEDTAVDPARLPEFIARFREILNRAGTDGAFYGHASVGCLHIRPVLDTRSRDDLKRMRRIFDEVSDLVLQFGGAMSGEHGDGMARSHLNKKLFGPTLYQAFKDVKATFDPAGLMNPGKVVDGPSPVDNLRLGPEQKRLEVTTTFDFSRQGGLAAAAELCNGSGVCRKTSTGTMCPSFMATGDEEHSTRGRANALRLVLSGALPAEELTGEQLYRTYDLCLGCKGCKAECPSNVDVAKLKAEFLNQYYRANGVPWRVRAMAHVARWNRLGAALAPFSNWMSRLPGTAWLAQRVAGVDRRRPLPRLARGHFRKWFRKRRKPNRPAPCGGIVLLDDCLSSYCEPGVNSSAVEVLEAAGHEVHLAGLECCGRALISCGLLDEAQALARRNVERLLPFAERGWTIVGSEPSCLLTLADDYLDLVPGDAAEVVARQSKLIETYLVENNVDLPLEETDAARRVLLHGHCHQKALVGVDDTTALLGRAGYRQIDVVDSGCCGMAGSFGYEHYELSMKIGERVLLPAVRACGDALVVAPGFSCRHQIEHGAGRLALHPIEVVAGRLRR